VSSTRQVPPKKHFVGPELVRYGKLGKITMASDGGGGLPGTESSSVHITVKASPSTKCDPTGWSIIE